MRPGPDPAGGCVAQVLKRLAGFDPEVVGELASAVLVDAKRLGLPARSIQRRHELAAGALPEWLAADEPLQLGDELSMASEVEVGLHSILDGAEPEFLEPSDLVLGEGFVGELDERRAAPEVERATDRRSRLLGVAFRPQLPPCLEKVREATQSSCSGPRTRR